MKEFTITQETSGQRLNKVLQKLLPGAGTSFLYKMLRKKNITVNDQKADGARILRSGDTIRIWFSDETYRKFSAENQAPDAADTSAELSVQPDVLYEDDDLLFINKPAGLLIQPDGKHTDCLTAQVGRYLMQEDKTDRSGIFRAGPANRLDYNTSGITAFGKTIRGQQYLAEQFRERSIKKYYLALAYGDIPCVANAEKILTGWYVKDHRENTAHLYTGTLRPASAIEVRLGVTPLTRNNESVLLRVHLLTGKSHQIRAQLAAEGHPLAGDPKYGDRRWNGKLARQYDLKRQFLHAYQLALRDINGKPLHVVAPIPGDLARVLKGEKLWEPGIPEA
ncbi:MAG: RluA family pseudouridine synthase [Lachnospira sp.]|nr:RluA family pseudouridine synthase [Lachnospira sp.]